MISWEIWSDDQLLYANGLPLEELQVLSPTFSMELGRAGELTFTAPPLAPMTQTYTETRYQRLMSTIYLKRNNVIKWGGRVLHDEKDFYGNKSVFCEGWLAFLNDTLAYEYSWGYGKKARNNSDIYFRDGPLPISTYSTTEGYYSTMGILNRFVELNNRHQLPNRDIKLGRVNVSPSDPTAVNFKMRNYEYDTIYNNLMNQFCNNDMFEPGYFQIRFAGENGTGNGSTPYLDYLRYGHIPGVTHISSQSIQFGENLLDLTDLIDTSEIFTIVCPLGAYTTDYKCKNGVNHIVNIVDGIKDEDKKKALWTHLKNEHPTIAKNYQDPLTNNPPQSDDFMSTEFPESEQASRLDVSSVNTATDPVSHETQHYSYWPTPDLWSNSQYNQYMNLYGRIERAVVYDEITDPAKLLSLGKKYLQDAHLTNTITVKAADLSYLGVSVDTLWLGDMIYIYGAPQHDINGAEPWQCTKIELKLDNFADSEFTFGNTYKGMTDRELSIAKRAKSNSEILSNNPKTITKSKNSGTSSS